MGLSMWGFLCGAFYVGLSMWGLLGLVFVVVLARLVYL